jgi:mRNA-degrading endonuclease toxin of MazEF toxin-antitoxin module
MGSRPITANFVSEERSEINSSDGSSDGEDGAKTEGQAEATFVVDLETQKTDCDVTQELNKIEELTKKLESMVKSLVTEDDLKRINIYLEWLLRKTELFEQENVFSAQLLPNFGRGDVVLVDFGCNVGDEFGGKHTAIVLKNSNTSNERVMVLPVTSKEPKNKNIPIYIEIGKIAGLNPTKHHWANVLNICSVSKQRIIYPPIPKRIDGRILDRISKTIQRQIALIP